VSRSERTARLNAAAACAAIIALLLPLFPAAAFQPGDRHVHLNGQVLEVTWDESTRMPQTITGVGSDLLEVKNISTLSKREINDIGALLVRKYGTLIRVGPEQLLLKKAEKTGGSWFVSYQQTVRGVAVFDSSLGFSIDPDGRIKSMGLILYPDARVQGFMKVHRGQALKSAQGSIPDPDRKDFRLKAETLVIYPDRKNGSVDYRQVFIFSLFPGKVTHPASPASGYAVFVDSRTGKVIRTQPELKPLGCCLPKEGIVAEESFQ
jgi:hypothetical protein